MKIQIIEKSISLSESQRALVSRRLTAALDRFADKVCGLTVTFSDLNGPRGGDDKLCRVRMLLRENGEIVLSENSDAVESAVTRIADRAANTVQRLVERRRLYQRNAANLATTMLRPATAVSTTIV
jgi:putative sigma-54 modulation protein